MSRRMEIGKDVWIRAAELEEGEVVFNAAKYVGEDEGKYGAFHRFIEKGQTFCIGGGDMNRLCQRLQEGDVVELHYNGEKEITKGNFSGKTYHSYNMWLVEDDEEDPEPKAKAKPAVKKRKAGTKKKAEEPEVTDDDLDMLE